MSSFFSLPISATVQTVPADYVPPDNMQGLLEAIPQFVNLALNDTGATVTINATGEGADLNGLYVWRLDQYKLPARLETGYRNNWWEVYTGKPTEIRMFAGSLGYFDGTGRGIEGSGWEGWALCNGQNGAADLRNHFIIPGYRHDGVAWVAQVYPKNVVEGQLGTVPDEGSVDLYASGFDHVTFKIALSNLPTVTLWLNGTDFFKWAPHGGELWTVTAPGEPKGNYNLSTYTYTVDQWAYMVSGPISRIPPYVALGFVEFVGYL